MPQEEQWQKIVKLAASVFLVIAAVFVLKTLRDIFVPLMLAVFVAYLFAQPVEVLARVKVPRILTFFLLLIAIAVAGVLLGRAMVRNIREFVELWPTYENKLLDAVAAFLKHELSLEPSALLELLRSQRVTDILSSMLKFSFSFFGKLALTLLILIFFYLSFKNYPKLIKSAFDDTRADYIFGIVNNINEQIVNYVLVKTFISAGTGFFTWLACALFGLKFAVLWGTLAFILNFIPYIGSFIAVVLPTVFSLVLFPHSLIPLFLFLSLFVIQVAWGSFLDPELMSARFNLSPIAIIISLVFWSYVWGVAGAFLAVPTTAIIKIILKNIPPLKFFAVLMSRKAD